MTGVPNIVKQRLQMTAKPGVHPDADLLAAFVERSLAQPEQDDMLLHLAECAECREVLALAVPEQTDGTETIRMRPGWSWPVLRWGAVAACVVVVGAAISLHYEALTTRHAGSSPTSDVAVVNSEPVATGTNTSSVTKPLPEYDSSVPSSSASRSAPETQAKAQSTSGAAALQQRQPRSAAPLSENAHPSGRALTIPGRAKDENSSAAEGKEAGETDTPQALASSAMAARAAVIPANAIPRWTLSADGTLQRSIDSGKTWDTILVAGPGVLRALTANGLDVWVGGAKGTLYHSMDAGQRWMQVQPSADGTALNADITGIEFDDLQNGTLTTADGQTWATADAGQSWTQQQ